MTGGWHEKSPCYCGRSAGVRSNKRERSGARGTRGSGCSLRSGRAWTGWGRSGWGDRLYGEASHRALVEKIRTATPRAVRKTVNGTNNQRSTRYKRPAAGSHGNCWETGRGSSQIGRSPKRNGARRAARMRTEKIVFGVSHLRDMVEDVKAKYYAAAPVRYAEHRRRPPVHRPL